MVRIQQTKHKTNIIQKKKRILLICVLRNYEKSYPSLSLGYLASYLLKNYDKDIDIKIIQKNYKKVMAEYKPDIVGISCFSEGYGISKGIAKLCKSKGIFNIIGGSHITCLPESLDKNMDLGVIGEGEETFLEIIDNKNLKDIKGIVYWKDGALIINQPKELIKDLSIIPYPARCLLEIDKNQVMPLITSRGCAYACRFCASKLIYKQRVRFLQTDYVINEIKEIINNYHPYYIHIYDEFFVANKKRLKELAEAIIKNNIHKHVKFIISTRADTITDETVKILKSMNTHQIGIGFESGSERVLNYLKNNTTTVKQNEEAVKIIKKYKIKVDGYFIIGSPMDTKKTILDTLNFIKKNKIDVANVFILSPLPGTEIWNYALKKGLISNDWDQFSWKQLHTVITKPYESIHLCENLTRKEFSDLCKKFIIYDKVIMMKQMFYNAIRSPERILPFIWFTLKGRKR